MSDMNLGTTDSRSDSMQANDSSPEARSGRGRIDISSVVRVAETHRLEDEAVGLRSEEHTSELQSRENLVCRLLLEKKNDQPVLRYRDHREHKRRNGGRPG